MLRHGIVAGRVLHFANHLVGLADDFVRALGVVAIGRKGDQGSKFTIAG